MTVYIAPLSLLAFGAELLWLVLSALVLSLIGNASIDARIATGSLVDQTAVIILIYLSVFYLMDLYQQELLNTISPSVTQSNAGRMRRLRRNRWT